MTPKSLAGNESIFISNSLNEFKEINYKFDIVTFWHVLEHLENPKKLIQIIDEKLNNKGFVVIEVPNFDSLQRIIEKKNLIHFECPRHVSHFTKKSLLNLFDDKKFKLIKISTFSDVLSSMLLTFIFPFSFALIIESIKDIVVIPYGTLRITKVFLSIISIFARDLIFPPREPLL